MKLKCFGLLSLLKNNKFLNQMHSSGVDKLLSWRPTFRARNSTCVPNQARKKMRAQNQSTYPIETQLETLLFVLYYLNSTYSFHF